MSERIVKNKHLLHTLNALNAKQRTQFLRILNNNHIHCICECVYNIINGQVPLKKDQLKRLIKYRHTLRRLVNKREAFNKKKKILIQSGGGLLPLILAPLLTGVFSNLFK